MGNVSCSNCPNNRKNASKTPPSVTPGRIHRHTSHCLFRHHGSLLDNQHPFYDPYTPVEKQVCNIPDTSRRGLVTEPLLEDA